jgi:bifunctional non-homologous end joining protein LigD
VSKSAPRSKTIEELERSGRPLLLTNLDKVLWPAAAFTKRQMLAYYDAISATMLPHIVDRPMVVARFPDGVEAEYWFQTQCPSPPAWVRTCAIPKASNSEVMFDYCVIDDALSLLWVANLGGIELHPLLSKAQSLDRPSSVVFDLDPGPRAGLLECCNVALRLRDLLASAGLSSYPKSTGATGLHVYVPLNSSIRHPHAKEFARGIARQLGEENENVVSDRSPVRGRVGKVLIDWAQNNPLRSLVAPYSLRGMPLPSVAAPLLWHEIESAVRHDAAESLIYLASDVLDRIEKVGDPLAPILTETQLLPAS